MPVRGRVLVSSRRLLQVVDHHVPGVLGGSADLTGNTGTKLEKAVALEPESGC